MRRLALHEKSDLVLGSRASFRIYADRRPRVLQTAKLQKGAIVVWDGNELVEEGLGIGVPVCKYSDGTRFSLDAETWVDDSERNRTTIKIYDMNGIGSKRFRRVRIRRDGYFARLLEILEIVYRGLLRFRVQVTLMLGLLSLLGMRNEYLESRSKGRIAVAYLHTKVGLRIRATFDDLSLEGLQSIIFANEQSGRVFDEYADSNGTKIRAGRVEPWRTTSAEWASVCSSKLGVGFRIHRPIGWLIVRGREVVRDRISWFGLDLVYKGIPQMTEYEVQVVGEAAN